MILGIDEAGRGPCIGPLVMCGAVIKDSQESNLKKLNIKDSKLISKSKRADLYKILKTKTEIIDYKIIKLQAFEIDLALNSKINNLNLLEAKTSAKIINYFLKKYNSENNSEPITKIILDCPSTNTKKYKETIINLVSKQKIKNKIEYIIEHKADEKYISVSSASILAKVTRDKDIEKLQKKYKKTIYGNLGSGYPSDVSTIQFLEKNYKKLENDTKMFRKTWKTYTNLVSSKKQKKLVDF